MYVHTHAGALEMYVACINVHQFVLCLFRHDGGSFNMAIFNMDLTSVVELGKDANGHLSITSVHCDAQIGDENIQFHGGARYSRTEILREKRRGDTDAVI